MLDMLLSPACFLQSACPASADRCRGVAGMAGHPLQTRSCGLFGLSKPSCMWVGQQQWSAASEGGPACGAEQG